MNMQAMTCIAVGCPLRALPYDEGYTPLNDPAVAMHLNEQFC